jgi:predicted site-specific integrase-resolvase
MKMKITDAAKAFNVNYRTIKRWVMEGKVRAEKKGMYLLVEAEDIVEQIKQNYNIIASAIARRVQLDRWEREREKQQEGGEM